MVDFDYSKVYTAVNADKLKIGSKVYVAKNFHALRDQVCTCYDTVCELLEVRSEDFQDRFTAMFNDGIVTMSTLAYLISEPEEKKLKWTDLKIGDVITTTTHTGIHTAMVTAIDNDDVNDQHIFAGSWLTDKELESYVKLEED